MSRIEFGESEALFESILPLPPGVFAHRKVCLTRDPKTVYGVAETDEETIGRAVHRIPANLEDVESLINDGTLSLLDQVTGEAYTLSGIRNKDHIHGVTDHFEHPETKT